MQGEPPVLTAESAELVRRRAGDSRSVRGAERDGVATRESTTMPDGAVSATGKTARI